MLFLIKKAVAPFLVPPGLFITLLAISAGYFFYRKQRQAGAVNLLIAALLWSLSIAPVSNALLQGLESGFSLPKDPHGDVIILLGGGVYGSAPDLTGTGMPSEEMLGRIVTAARLQRGLDIPLIVSGGAVYEGDKAEAPIVRRVLVDLGIPGRKIILEEKSRDTIENATYTAELCKRYGFNGPLLVTSASHMRRAVMSFRKIGLQVTPVPSNFKTGSGAAYGWEDYLPRSLEGSAIAFKEYLGLLFYTFAY